MKLYVEVIILFILAIIFFGWSLWNNITLRKARKNYNPDDDKSRKGEELRRRVEEGEPIVAKTSDGTPRPAPVEERRVLQTTETSVDGKTSNGSRTTSSSTTKTGRRTRNFFELLKRRS